jgi:hypothetical protein
MCTHACEIRVEQPMRNLRARATAIALMHVFGFGVVLARSAESARSSHHFDIVQPYAHGSDVDRMLLCSGGSSRRPLQRPRVAVRRRAPSSRECPSFDVCAHSQRADRCNLSLHVSTLMQVALVCRRGRGAHVCAPPSEGTRRAGGRLTPDTPHERRKKQRGRESHAKIASECAESTGGEHRGVRSLHNGT